MPSSETSATRTPGAERPVMPEWSRYAGQKIAENGRNSIATLEPIKDDATQVVFDLFRHEGADWRAVVPIRGVRGVCGQSYNFSAIKTRRGERGPEIIYRRTGLPKRRIPVLNHVQCRFFFDDDHPVRLYPHASATTGEPAYELRDIVYSVEATGPPGVVFNLRDAVFGHLVCTHRFLSTQEMVFERIAVEGQYVVESAPLNVSRTEVQQLLTTALKRSEHAGMAERYQLVRMCSTNNCTSTPFSILDRVVDYNWRQWIGARLYRLPLNPRVYLRLRGLDSQPGFRKFLRSEFEDYLNASATRARRREHVRHAISQRRKAQGRPQRTG